MCLTILQNKITGTLTSEKNRRHIKMTAFKASWASVEQSVRLLALFKQSSVEQEGTAHFSLLFHVEDEVPEVDSCDFLPGVLPGRGRAQPGRAAPAHPRALQESTARLSPAAARLQHPARQLILNTFITSGFYCSYFFCSSDPQRADLSKGLKCKHVRLNLAGLQLRTNPSCYIHWRCIWPV